MRFASLAGVRGDRFLGRGFMAAGLKWDWGGIQARGCWVGGEGVRWRDGRHGISVSGYSGEKPDVVGGR